MNRATGEEAILEQYKKAYGDDVGEEKLKEYVYYQRLIQEAKDKNKKKQKMESVEVEHDNGEMESDTKLTKKRNKAEKIAMKSGF